MNYRRLDEIASAAAAAAAAASIIALLATCGGTTTTCAEDGYKAEATVYETYIYKYEETETEAETAVETTPETEQMCTDYVSAWVEPVSEVSEPETAAMTAAAAYTDDEMLLMRIAYAEAGNQGVEGQALVMRVILNRIADVTFPNTVYDVIFQTEQFAGAYADAFYIAELPDDTKQALELVKSGWDGSQGALYFCRPHEGGWHDLNLTELFTYGDHIFYK